MVAVALEVRGYIGIIAYVYWGSLGIVEKRMETTIMGYMPAAKRGGGVAEVKAAAVPVALQLYPAKLMHDSIRLLKLL